MHTAHMHVLTDELGEERFFWSADITSVSFPQFSSSLSSSEYWYTDFSRGREEGNSLDIKSLRTKQHHNVRNIRATLLSDFWLHVYQHLYRSVRALYDTNQIVYPI